MKKIFLGVMLTCLMLITSGFTMQKDVKPQSKSIEISESIPGLYVVKINTQHLKGEIKPHYVVHLTTNKDIYEETKAKLVVNAGFFDPKNEQTISYLTIDDKPVLDPHRNSNLMNNVALKPYLPKIFNRSEFRVLIDKDGKLKYDIAPHNYAVPEGYKIKYAIQGGPQLLPTLRLEEEFFVLKKDGKIVSQSASSLRKYARTAIGIKDNDVYIIIATTKVPMTLEQVANYAKTMELEKAMAFDGGGSTSIDVEDLHIVSDKDSTARKLKSFLIVTD
ncbi:MAG: phosphodiester glycosidase family protein [Candidatus Gastranaerophilales bacterium]|nr:phosphodiester glycosidase family protein [Candidatus Gastranaerophilales bacterium]